MGTRETIEKEIEATQSAEVLRRFAADVADRILDESEDVADSDLFYARETVRLFLSSQTRGVA